MSARRSPDVDAFLDAKDHPLRELIDQLRDTLLEAHPHAAEAVKWGGPTLVLAGTTRSMATITLRGKKALTLFFPEGAGLPDPLGVLKGDAAKVRTMRFEEAADIEAATQALHGLVRAFVETHRG